MKKIIVLLCISLSTCIAYGQNIFKAIVRDADTMEPLAGATAVVKGTLTGGIADANGELTIPGIPGGKQVIEIRFMGYNNYEETFDFPLEGMPLIILLTHAEGDMDEIIIEGTRSNKSIDNIPTRVEVLTEEIDEASTMDPSKIAHLITHSTGIQVQQTSATSNTANVRIQGLDGRYTQILKDGFPLYGGFSGSLSIMQIPPLDLRQVEYIKGGASTLYGGGAISGLINLISKDAHKDETLLHLNASQVGAFDVNAFVSRKIGNVGFTLLGQRNTHQVFDADDDGYSDLPQLTKYNLNPRLFFDLGNRTRLMIGGTFTEEVRQGGDVELMNMQLADSTHFYKETNDISRITTQLKLDHKLSESGSLIVRNSFNIFHRGLSITPSPAVDEYRFAGDQLSTFSEAAHTWKNKKHHVVSGVNFYSEQFSEDSLQSAVMRDEQLKTVGAFVNYNLDITPMVAVEAGFRGDYVFDEEFFALPRAYLLFKWTPKLTTRIGAGMGYRNATIFNQEAELLGYKNVLPIDRQNVNAERSFGGTADIGYKTPLGEDFFLTINQMFFYTQLDKPLVLADTGSSSNIFHFVNADGFTRSMGAETFFKFGFYDFVLFVGYTYTDATNQFADSTSALTLTPRHSLKGDLLYALPGKWRVGLDYEMKSSQILSNGTETRAYWTFGAVVEYTTRQFTLFGNVENYTNVRQTKWESLKSQPYGTPQFTEVWAPLDGIVVNAGIKVRL